MPKPLLLVRIPPHPFLLHTDIRNDDPKCRRTFHSLSQVAFIITTKITQNNTATRGCRIMQILHHSPIIPTLHALRLHQPTAMKQTQTYQRIGLNTRTVQHVHL